MSQTVEHVQTAYDRVAEGYDELWSRHVSGPNERLTRALVLAPGCRVADLACGTGVASLQMARLVAPGEVVGVDCSLGMLQAARERAAGAGFALTLVPARAEEFIGAAPPASFDAVSLRFALAYLDWGTVLPTAGRLLRPGGRVGVLTSLSTSIPQFYDLYERFRDSPGAAWKLFKHFRRSLPAAWRNYRHLRGTFGRPRFINVPDSAMEVAARLSAGGLRTREVWTERVRLWFASGDDAVQWMSDSGYVTNADLERVPAETLRFLRSLFARGMETFREDRGVPLDLVIAGVVAERRR